MNSCEETAFLMVSVMQAAYWKQGRACSRSAFPRVAQWKDEGGGGLGVVAPCNGLPYTKSGKEPPTYVRPQPSETIESHSISPIEPNSTLQLSAHLIQTFRTAVSIANKAAIPSASTILPQPAATCRQDGRHLREWVRFTAQPDV
jgi:hypothetical protein